MKIDITYINNTKIANSFRKYKNLSGCKIEMDVGRSKGEVVSEVSISKDLSAFDCAVADAIYTIYKNSEIKNMDSRDFSIVFSVGQVLRVLSGNPKQTITLQKRKEINESIKKMRKTRIEINCTEEMEVRGLKKKPDDYEICGQFLQIDWLEKESKYRLKDIGKSMPLYSYAEKNRQMITFPIDLLTYQASIADKKISDTRENILIKRYLIQRLEIMRYKLNHSSKDIDGQALYTIKYRRMSHKTSSIVGMYAEIDIFKENFKSADSWKHKKHSIHNTVIKILDYYKVIGYIDGYEVIKEEAGRIEGVKITGSINNPWEKVKSNALKSEK